MKKSKLLLLLAISSLILLTGCSGKRVPAPCPSIITLSRVDDVNVTTNSAGGLDADETLKIFRLVYSLREVERYYQGETTRLDFFTRERNKGLLDG